MQVRMAAHAIAPALDADTLLMLGVREGRTELFDTLLLRYRDPLVGYLYRMTGDHAAAEDIAQEVFLRVYRSRLRYEPTAKFATWLYRIATNLALNWRRDRGCERRVVPLYYIDGPGRSNCLADCHPGIEQQLVERAEAGSIRRIIDDLPDRQRAAVLMHHYQNLSHAEIARALRCSTHAVKSVVFRAYATLRTRLAEL
jgi:RNA polymerase sigma-70 factor (ECF subfamily)